MVEVAQRATRHADEIRDKPARSNKINVRNLNFFYGSSQALHNISMDIQQRVVTAFIGPSGCGKSTFIRTLNRMNDVIPGTRVEGQVLIDGRDIYSAGTDVVELRRRVGMVFQKSNPFPKSIFDNIAYGLRINRLTRNSRELADRVEDLGVKFVGRATTTTLHSAGASHSA